MKYFEIYVGIARSEAFLIKDLSGLIRYDASVSTSSMILAFDRVNGVDIFFSSFTTINIVIILNILPFWYLIGYSLRDSSKCLGCKGESLNCYRIC